MKTYYKSIYSIKSYWVDIPILIYRVLRVPQTHKRVVLLPIVFFANYSNIFTRSTRCSYTSESVIYSREPMTRFSVLSWVISREMVLISGIFWRYLVLFIIFSSLCSGLVHLCSFVSVENFLRDVDWHCVLFGLSSVTVFFLIFYFHFGVSLVCCVLMLFIVYAIHLLLNVLLVLL